MSSLLMASVLVAGAIHVRPSRRCAEGGHEVGDESFDLGLGFGAEVLLGVELADGVAEDAVDEGDAADVARAHLVTPWRTVPLKAKRSSEMDLGRRPP